MNKQKILRKSLTFLLTVGATVAIGFLSFSGMFILTPSLIWCCAAFALAAGYEGQVNAEGISSALRRMFDKNYLKKGILRRYLDDLLEQNDDSNVFIKDYRAQKAYVEKLREIHHPNAEQAQKIAQAKKQLRNMELFFFNQYEKCNEKKDNVSAMEKSVRDLILLKKAKLDLEIKRKTWLIRASLIFAVGGGVSSGLAAFSAIKVGIASFALLSAIPGGVLIGLAACAAIGYTLLLYQSISDMVQQYSGKWKNYFNKRQNESSATHILRCVATVLTIGVAIVATIATAGTWWYAAKQGASLLNFSEKAANALRSVSVALMALPTFIFSTSNSIASVDNISRSSYKKLFFETMTKIKKAWETETLFQFLNPFRFVEKICSYTAKGIFFLGHVVSIGLISDRFDALPAVVSAGANATGEALTDLNYLPDQKKEHNHDSKLLKVLFLPVTITVTVLKLFAVLWDRVSSGSFKKSWKNIFPSCVSQKEPEKPMLSGSWNQQPTFAKTKASEKVLSVKKEDVLNSNAKFVVVKPLAKNHALFWNKSKTLTGADQAVDLNSAPARNFSRVD